MATLVSSFLRDQFPPAKHQRSANVRAQATQIVEDCYSEAGLTVVSLAARLHLSVRQLYRRFEGGESPAELIARRRTEEAVRVLRSHRNMRVGEVATLVGFIDDSTLRTHLRRLRGVTPRELRRNARTEDRPL